MAVNNIIKRIQNVMRQDAGINGDAQRIEQMVWMFFLKVYDAQEEVWECTREDGYTSIIPEELRWRNWAVDNADGNALTGDELLDFVNNTLFPTLKDLDVNADTPRSQLIVKEVFSDLNQYMKNGILLRQTVNIIDEIDFAEADDEIIRNATMQALDILKKLGEDKNSFRKLGLTFEEKAFYDILMHLRDTHNFEYGEDKKQGSLIINDKCKDLAKKVKELIDTKSMFADWLTNVNVRANLNGELFFSS